MLNETHLVGVTPASFPYLVGANCYQDAAGVDVPVITIKKIGEDHFIDFVTLIPGNPHLSSNELNPAQYATVILAGCFADNAVDLGNKIEFKDGYNTVALYFSSEENDFHFVTVFEDGSGRSKRILCPIELADKFEELSGGYKLDRFLLLPKGILPPSVERLDPQPIYLVVANNAVVKCLQIADGAIPKIGSSIGLERQFMAGVHYGESWHMKVPERFQAIMPARTLQMASQIRAHLTKS